jgi:hypothetical protein
MHTSTGDHVERMTPDGFIERKAGRALEWRQSALIGTPD